MRIIKVCRLSFIRILILCLLGVISSSTIAKQTTLMTWNLEWLSSSPYHKFPASNRHTKDYKKLQKYFQSVQPDILAFQEVNDLDAIRRVVGSQYQLYLSDRSTAKYAKNQFGGINQYTGFAVRNSVSVLNQADIKLEKSKTSRLRFASYIVLERPGKKPMHLLSVHLKAGCTGKYFNSHSCIALKREGSAIHTWVVERTKRKQPYIILGDFNHQLTRPGDWLWKLLSNNLAPKPALITKNTNASCLTRSSKSANKTHRYRRLIDHIIASPSISLSPATQHAYTKNDVLSYRLSDHCPVSTDIVD